MRNALKSPPRVHRLQVARPMSALGKIESTSGRYGAGLIPGVSLCSRGEALGHDAWVDAVMLQQIVDGCNSNPKLLKSRFTHPDLCGDGTGKALGTIENARLQGDQAVGDLHLYQTAHNAPDGDLAGYVMSLAAEDPSNFGLSIVFEHDWDAEDAFESENTREVQLNDDVGNVVDSFVEFLSPDPLNTGNLPHARIKRLCASDVVDDPAANPHGLFHRKMDLLADGTALLDFATGRTTQPPALSAFSIAPERVRDFLSKYLAAAGLTIVSKDVPMQTKLAAADPPEEQPKDEAQPDPKAEKPAEDNPDDKKPDAKKPGDETEEEPDDEDKTNAENTDKKPEACSTAQLKKFVAKFGSANGSTWAIEGISYETALERHLDLITTELTDANNRLQAIGQSGTTPVKFSHGATTQQKGTTSQSSAKLQEVCGDGLARIAAAIRLPSPN